MQDLRKIMFYLNLKIEHLRDEIFVHKSNYIEKIMKKLHMDKTHLLKSSMVIRSFNIHDDPFHPRER